jgi:hypothetical protein
LLITSDSKSALSALAAGPLQQKSYVGGDIWRYLFLVNNSFFDKIIFQIVFSHCGVDRNELADKDADTALKSCDDNQHLGPIHIFDAIKAEVKFGLKSNWLQCLDKEQNRSATT